MDVWKEGKLAWKVQAWKESKERRKVMGKIRGGENKSEDRGVG
jgi:hypothetical protein